MQVVQASSNGQTEDGRETCAFFLFFVFCLSIAISERAKKKQKSQHARIGFNEVLVMHMVKWREKETAKSQRESRTKVERKSTENRSKIDQNRRNIEENSILGGFGRSEPFRERAGTRSGRDRDAPNSPQGRSWSAPGEPRAARSHPKASPGQSREAPGPPRSGVRARLEYRALSNMITERLLVVFALARGSSDVCFVLISVFTVFCWLRAN